MQIELCLLFSMAIPYHRDNSVVHFKMWLVSTAVRIPIPNAGAGKAYG